MTVKFDDMDGFLEELTHHVENVDDNVVRLARKQQEVNQTLYRVGLRAGFRVEGEVYQLDLYCGEDESGNPVGSRQYNDDAMELKEKCSLMQIDVRSGEFEVA